MGSEQGKKVRFGKNGKISPKKALELSSGKYFTKWKVNKDEGKGYPGGVRLELSVYDEETKKVGGFWTYIWDKDEKLWKHHKGSSTLKIVCISKK